MLRFSIVESQGKICENKTIALMGGGMKGCSSHDIISKEFEETIFILAEEKKDELIGGACLFKRDLNAIQEDVRELVTTLPLRGHVWECSNVYLGISYKNLDPEKKDFGEFCQSFYRGLYEGLVEFGKQKKVGFIIMKLFPEVYGLTKKFGLWPYVVELRPENSPDGLFHGILPLTGSQYEAYRKTWKD